MKEATAQVFLVYAFLVTTPVYALNQSRGLGVTSIESTTIVPLPTKPRADERTENRQENHFVELGINNIKQFLINDVVVKSGLFRTANTEPNYYYRNMTDLLRSRQPTTRNKPQNVKLSTQKIVGSQNQNARYLLCFLDRDTAGLVTQERHLIECALLAVKLGRTLITPPLVFSAVKGSNREQTSRLRFFDEMIDMASLNTDIPELKWIPGRVGHAFPNTTASVDVAQSSQSKKRRAPAWVSDYLMSQLHFLKVVERRASSATSGLTIGTKRKLQQTLIVVLPSEDARPVHASRRADVLVAQLQPVAWFKQLASLARKQLFHQSNPRYLAMHIVRGNELVKCLTRLALQTDIPNPVRSNGNQLDSFLDLMRQCVQGDRDVEAVISTIQHKFGLLNVYLAADEYSEESLRFFQEQGYKTRFDSVVMRAHLSGADGLFLDHVMCTQSSLFVGSQKSKLSKQIVSLRDTASPSLPSFILKVK